MPKFKVHLQQFVERITTMEVEAEDKGMAMQIAKRDSDRATWQDGDDAYSVDVYSVYDEAGTAVYER